MSKNIKFFAVFSACGFLISFVSGLFSRSSIGIVLLRALLFGVVFCGLAVCIQFIFDKFLAVDQAAGETPDAPEEKKTGGLVDITVQDEELPQEENAPQFFVGSNHQLLNKNDYSVHGEGSGQEEQPVAESPAASAVPNVPSSAAKTAAVEQEKQFVPVSFAETAKNLTGTEAAPVTAVGNKTTEKEETQAAQQENGSGDDSEDSEEDIDELPDMDDIDANESDDEDGVVEDSEFSQKGVMKKENSAAGGADAALMAKAVSTLLAQNGE